MALIFGISGGPENEAPRNAVSKFTHEHLLAGKGRSLQPDRTASLPTPPTPMCPGYSNNARMQRLGVGLPAGRPSQFAFKPSGRRLPPDNPNCSSSQVSENLGRPPEQYAAQGRSKVEEPLYDPIPRGDRGRHLGPPPKPTPAPNPPNPPRKPRTRVQTLTCDQSNGKPEWRWVGRERVIPSRLGVCMLQLDSQRPQSAAQSGQATPQQQQPTPQTVQQVAPVTASPVAASLQMSVSAGGVSYTEQ